MNQLLSSLASRSSRLPGFKTAATVAVTALLPLACGTRVSGGNDAAAKGQLRPAVTEPPRLSTSADVAPTIESSPIDTSATRGMATAPHASAQGPSRAVRAAEPKGATIGSGKGTDGQSLVGGVPPGSPAPKPALGEDPGSEAPSPVPGGEGIAAADRSAVAVASVGTYSGPVGSLFTLILQGAQLWVKHINSNGGLNGHSVKLLVYDDGGDPARHRAQVQEAIERRHVVAFIANGEAITGGGSVNYITEKRIPVIGMSSGEAHGYASPMFFPPYSTGDVQVYSWIASVAARLVPLGKTKFGLLGCIEVEACDDWVATRAASDLGYQLVYKARASLAEPDYTAQCLAARNAGAEVLLLATEGTMVARVVSSCVRQGYRPVFTNPGSGTRLDWKHDPNFDGYLSNSLVFPWFQTGTPATDEFHRAYNAFGQGFRLSISTAQGWVVGKLLEKASANLPEPPTSEAVLKGLWSIKDDDLGGLAMPLTFVENQAPPKRSCWYDLEIKDRSWVSPDGAKFHCSSKTLSRH